MIETLFHQEGYILALQKLLLVHEFPRHCAEKGSIGGAGSRIFIQNAVHTCTDAYIPTYVSTYIEHVLTYHVCAFVITICACMCIHIYIHIHIDRGVLYNICVHLSCN